MKRSLRLLFLFVCVGVISAPCVAALEKKPLTFMVYLAAANSLYEFSDRDLAEMMKIGSNEYINVIVYLTVQHEGEEKVTKRLYIKEGSMEQIGPDMQMDSGDVHTLMDALSWAHNDFPSDHTVVVLWNHGSGPLNRTRNLSLFRGICYDDDTNNYLTDLDCLHAFSWARDELRGGKKYDIIACDACLMAGIEIAYSFAPCADYFVASQDTIPGDGYEYARVLAPFKDGTMSPRSLARRMVKAYADEYQSQYDFTLSAVDLRLLDLLVSNTNTVSQLLERALKGKRKRRVFKTIKKSTSRRKCLSFDDGSYIDLYRFYRNMRKYSSKMKLSKKDRKELKTELKKGMRLIKKCVIANVRSKAYKKARGLSIYFPRFKYGIHPSYYDLYWSTRTDWLSLISTYVG